MPVTPHEALGLQLQASGVRVRGNDTHIGGKGCRGGGYTYSVVRDTEG